MAYSNKDFIDQGVPKSALLPGTSYWKKKSTFISSTAIWNWDNVTTNKSGSKITLNASKDFYGELGSVSFGVGAIKMSVKNDTLSVRCINPSSTSEGDAFALLGKGDIFVATTGATLDLGNGENSVTAGLGQIAWKTGVHIGSESRLLSGSGKDVLKAAGVETGISVGGLISTGGGDDIIEGTSTKTHGILISSGRIDMGSGNDRLTGIGQVDDLGHGSIYSNGWIDMGDGDDEITGTSFMINGAQVGQAQLSMGTGNDKLIATLHHSNAPIDFGDGIDRLYLPSGQYNISDLGSGFFSLVSTGENEGVYGADKISGLESIVSKNTGAEYALSSGTLTVA